MIPGPALYRRVPRLIGYFFCASSDFELSVAFDLELSVAFGLSVAFELFDLTSTLETLWELGSKLARTLSPGCNWPIDALFPSRVIWASFATLSRCSSPDCSTMVMTIASGSVASTSPTAGKSALAPPVAYPADNALGKRLNPYLTRDTTWFTIGVQLPSTADNTFQGRAATLALNWHITQ